MKTLISALSMLALVAVFTVPAHAQMATGPAGGSMREGQNGRERHPEIHRAMHSLEIAKDALSHAAHDYEGHRSKAAQHIDEAISELQQALAVDKH